MEIKLKDNKIFRTTVEGQDIKVGAEPVKVKDSIGQYLIESFPQIVEEVKTKKEV